MYNILSSSNAIDTITKISFRCMCGSCILVHSISLTSLHSRFITGIVNDILLVFYLLLYFCPAVRFLFLINITICFIYFISYQSQWIGCTISSCYFAGKLAADLSFFNRIMCFVIRFVCCVFVFFQVKAFLLIIFYFILNTMLFSSQIGVCRQPRLH